MFVPTNHRLQCLTVTKSKSLLTKNGHPRSYPPKKPHLKATGNVKSPKFILISQCRISYSDGRTDRWYCSTRNYFVTTKTYYRDGLFSLCLISLRSLPIESERPTIIEVA